MNPAYGVIVLFSCFLVVACDHFRDLDEEQKLSPTYDVHWDLRLRPFKDCEEIKAYVDERNLITLPGVVETQEDWVAKSNDTIFVSRSDHIYLIDRATLRPKGELDQPLSHKRRLHVVGDRLVSISEFASKCPSSFMSESQRLCIRATVQVDLFRLSRKASPELIDRQFFVGRMRSSYADETDLSLITQQDHWMFSSDFANGRYFEERCDQVRRPVLTDSNLELTTLRKITITDKLESQSKITLMSANVFMVSGHDVFLVKTKSEFPASYKTFLPLSSESVIVRIGPDKRGSLDVRNVGFVDGPFLDSNHLHYVSDQQALLAVTYPVGADVARLLALDLAEYEMPIASEQMISSVCCRNVHFADTRLYLLLSEKTNSLAIYDTSRPLNPRHLGRIENTPPMRYIQTLHGSRVLGWDYVSGEYHQGGPRKPLELALMDVHGPLRYEVLDHKTIGGSDKFFDGSRSTRTWFYDGGLKMGAIPFVEFDSQTYDGIFIDSGLLLLSIDRGVGELGRISHRDILPEACHDEQTGNNSIWSSKNYDATWLEAEDDVIISFSRFGYRIHLASRPDQVLQTHEFSNNWAECKYWMKVNPRYR